ncbi:docking domain of Afi1 for Arf3 in vesicle trafficking-domain-containing protein [Protomyces lactucae-debilis]|uniref:Docking domain of Afi1 for Arf3 in vesicle trafficking-domain-containing protein n=1 Tax=Protomyces lactucae-debilis TaxID=2754530 RepID=A0A1Y2F9D0_PROLT|nr:docking domain of Afi1 for Arf3 in vesicle trafficking-domain-containing protein [Protomyces lactucae-debilis]ORY79505.1 docking domain of Afi1 for Arf3 in vesicle trafficking-domain-containing protein [Protomyces lactucae-debilis]
MGQVHVEYLLVAEFDIDRGPTIAHQYPEVLSRESNVLAELMLPDQTHVRSEDWTIFFLQRNAIAGDPLLKINEHSESSTEDSAEDNLLYVLSLVNTKHDKSVKRGAQVKALAIVTRHAYLHVYKPVLLLALDEYYKNPTLSTLEVLYQSVNAMDLSAMPKLNELEKLILVASDQDAVLSQHTESTDDKRHSDQSAISSPISTVSDRMSQMLLGNTQNSGPASPGVPGYHRDTQHFSTFVDYLNVKVPVRIPLATFPELVGDFSIIQLIQIFTKNASNNSSFQILHPELTTSGSSTHPVMVLMNALLTQKRIVFLGLARPSGDVAQHVLAACALGSGGCGLLRGFTERAFPYTDLSKIEEVIQVPGFIAGVTNSVFELHPEWWDILCNLDTGAITISSELQDSFVEPSPTSSVFNFTSLAHGVNAADGVRSVSHLCDYSDAGFMADIEMTIQERASEHTMRMKFRDWTHRLVKTAVAYELDKYGHSNLLPPREVVDQFELAGTGWVWPDEQSKQRDLLSNASRIEGWRGTESYLKFGEQNTRYWHKQLRASRSADAAIAATARIVSLDLWYQIEQLRVLSHDKLTLDESARIYTTLAKEVRTPLQVTELLSLCPLSQGGLQWLAHGCWHPDHLARVAAAELLERIEESSIGVHFIGALNMYFRRGYQRLKQEIAANVPIEFEAPAISTNGI